MSKVFQFPERKNIDAMMAAELRRNLAFFREHAGGDSASDEIWIGRIQDAIEQFRTAKSDDEKLAVMHRAMFSLVVETTGGQLPVGWPFHHK